MTARTVDGSLVVVPVGELDIATVESVRDAAGRRESGQGLVIDLSGLEFLDTSGIAFVVEAYRDAREEGFPLRIVRANARVHRVFEIAGLEGVLPFEDREGGGDGEDGAGA